MKKQENTNKRDSIVFYRSYYEAIETLSVKNKLLAYEAIIKYALNQEVAKDLPVRVLAILKMAMPNIDANNRKYNNRLKSNEQKNNFDFEKDFEGKVLLPKKKNVSMINNCFAENDDTDYDSE